MKKILTLTIGFVFCALTAGVFAEGERNLISEISSGNAVGWSHSIDLAKLFSDVNVNTETTQPFDERGVCTNSGEPMTITCSWGSTKTISSIRICYSNNHYHPAGGGAYPKFYSDVNCLTEVFAAAGGETNEGLFKWIEYTFSQPVVSKELGIKLAANNGQWFMICRVWPFGVDGGTAPLQGGFLASPVVGPRPLTVDFTASVQGGTEEYTYQWDYEGTGDYVPGGAAPSHVYTVPGVYSVNFKCSDGVNEISSGHENMIVVTEAYYFDSDADAGGDGSAEHPFNSYADALAVAPYAHAMYFKGTFDIDPTVSMQIVHPGFIMTKWGDDDDPNPMLLSVDNVSAAHTGVFDIQAGNVVVSNVNFRYTADLQKHVSSTAGGPLFHIEENNVTFTGCSFEMVADNDAAKYDYENGVIKQKDRNKNGLLITDCYFSNFNLGPNTTFRVLVVGGVRVEHSVFTNCASIISIVDNTFDTTQQFISNIVYDTACNTLTVGNGINNHNVGAVGGAIRVNSGMLCKQIEVFGNLFVNHSVTGGCVFDITYYAYNNVPSTFPLAKTDSVLMYNNTVVGYDALVFVGNPYCVNGHLSIYNNLSIGDTYTLVDKFSSDPGFQAASGFFRNNYRTGGADAFDTNYDPSTTLGAVADNIVTNAPIFKSTNSSNKNYYIPRKDDKAAWLFNAYTADGKYPDYIGAFVPMKPDGMEIHIR